MSRAPLRVVITGASSGIGAATAVAFARQGARLVLGARGTAGLDDIALRCRGAGGTADAVPVDVTDPRAVADFAADARARLGGIDLWFSCVGVGVLGKYQDVPLADHQRVIEANLLSHMNEAHAVLPIFLAQDRGTWVNMISIGGFFATSFAAAYSASKFGLRGFSQALRGELSKNPRIHICDVYPTFVDTPAIGHAGNYTGARLSMPPGSLAPETVAKAVVRLARHPRNTTVLGAPALALKLGQFAVPNLSAAMMNGFMERWSREAERGEDGSGTLFDPPSEPSGIEGGQRRPEQRRAAAAAAGATALGAAALGAWLWRRRR
ncbi:SDR family oxidoreductase [Sphingomonas desiccabilis]|uniref:SDR family oxidoreductase n=1 Tax=Sphingomonas desiccabilis TaxID=429134 RepID=A0A4Q2J202_9SPHN|nr:SDR family oxidoreductase [Sphingomonas desiccabilis]MBB3910931.1 short-subunit dehydrogenase [Sphingomonas desiccabilis]RXZ35521.1 SDR family oxidoreductase [Sphingomonas desiccabilis]